MSKQDVEMMLLLLVGPLKNMLQVVEQECWIVSMRLQCEWECENLIADQIGGHLGRLSIDLGEAALHADGQVDSPGRQR